MDSSEKVAQQTAEGAAAVAREGANEAETEGAGKAVVNTFVNTAAIVGKGKYRGYGQQYR